LCGFFDEDEDGVADGLGNVAGFSVGYVPALIP
jgi:hypothetical protein